MTETRLYYEAHINFPHPTEEQAEKVREICSRQMFWKMATFEMHKDQVPTGFCTGRNRVKEEIQAEVLQVITEMEAAGIEVLRWKIEDTVLDSKYGDSLSMLQSTRLDCV